MKKITLTIIVLTIICSTSFAQKKLRTYNPTYKNIMLTAGYVPDSDFKAFKGMIMVNNIIKKRIGAYYSYENGKGSYSENILGATFGINTYLFVYAGLGLEKKTDYDDARYSDGGLRKEAGVGFTPYKFTTATIGWSKGVGFTFTAGINIPLWDKRDKRYTAYNF